MLTTPQPDGPLERPPGPREVALAQRWRRFRAGVPSALYLFSWAVLILLAGILVGWLLAKAAPHDAFGRADARADRVLAADRTPRWNTITHWVTDLSETRTIAIMAIVTVIGAALAWRRWREPMLVAVAVTGEVLIFLGITTLVDRARPPVSHLDKAPPTSSFPSGHTAAAICMYGALALLSFERSRSLLLRGLLVLLAVAVPVAVAVARVYRGMHYPTDVLGGAVLGATWLAVTVRGIRLGVVHDRLRTGTGRLGRFASRSRVHSQGGPR
jgi:membrane-associated phospholipid phosphatase